MKLSMFLDLVCKFIKLVFEIFSVKDNFLVFLAQLMELFIHFVNFISDRTKFALVVLSAHFMLFKLSEKRL